MVIGHRARDRDLNDERALERCKPNLRTAITYVLGRIEATGTSPGGETKHRLTMARLRGMPVEMLDRKYNLHRMENAGVNLDDRPQYRSYQTFYEMGVAPPTHQEMADIVIQARRCINGPRLTGDNSPGASRHPSPSRTIKHRRSRPRCF